MLENADPAEITRMLVDLRQQHRDLDAAIERLAADARADQLAVQRLKKRKLWLRDCIARLESALIPDEPA
ncbi:YdcH family protein [Lysobacter korlensis]|uniref:YdcH family protein n=1 Tax=Lysobacter korlensis TaxID=553636 RepID=A0ABV6RHU7_9GAMM